MGYKSAKENVDNLLELRDRGKSGYAKILNYFKIAGMKSDAFMMTFDNFFFPGDILMSKSPLVRKLLSNTLCRNMPLDVETLEMLWGFISEADLEEREKKRKAKKTNGEK